MTALTNTPQSQTRRLLMLVTAGTCLLVACGAENPAATGNKSAAAASVNSQPNKGKTLHALYWSRSVRGDGDPDAIRDYRARVEICQNASFPLRKLDETDVEKLGKTQHEQWMDDKRMIVVTTSWSLHAPSDRGIAESCQFSLEEKKYLRDEAWEIHPIDAESRAKTEEWNQSLGWSRQGHRTILGQRCAIWVNGDQRLCMWDGSEYGFSEDYRVIEECPYGVVGGDEVGLPLEHVQGTHRRNCDYVVEFIRTDEPIIESVWRAAAEGAQSQ